MREQLINRTRASSITLPLFKIALFSLRTYSNVPISISCRYEKHHAWVTFAMHSASHNDIASYVYHKPSFIENEYNSPIKIIYQSNILRHNTQIPTRPTINYLLRKYSTTSALFFSLLLNCVRSYLVTASFILDFYLLFLMGPSILLCRKTIFWLDLVFHIYDFIINSFPSKSRRKSSKCRGKTFLRPTSP